MTFALHVPDLPVYIRPDRPLSDEELMEFCARNDKLRIERNKDGELLVMSPTGGGTSHKNSDINYQLTKWARETEVGLTFDSNAGFTLPDGSMRSPDAAWIAWSRWNALSEADKKRFSPICPEFVIELRSETDGLAELQNKMREWVENGAEVAWLIDPSRKTVEVYRAGREVEVVEGGSAVEGDGPVAGFVLELGRVWG